MSGSEKRQLADRQLRRLAMESLSGSDGRYDAAALFMGPPPSDDTHRAQYDKAADAIERDLRLSAHGGGVGIIAGQLRFENAAGKHEDFDLGDDTLLEIAAYDALVPNALTGLRVQAFTDERAAMQWRLLVLERSTFGPTDITLPPLY